LFQLNKKLKMKNVLKFGFLGLALTVAVASCNNAETKTEAAADSAANAIDSTANAVADSITNTADSAVNAIDSAANKAVDSVKNVQ